MSNPKKLAGLSPAQWDAAALAALDLLPPGEAMAAPRPAIGVMQETAALLAETAPSLAPAPGLKDRLMARVAAYEEIKPVADVRRDENTWRPSDSPGVDTKLLFHEPALSRSTYLVRMAPGAHLPAHRHGDLEQCLVLEGDIRWGEIVYEKGDFVAMGKDTEHPEIFTVQGNLLLLIAGRNEFHAG